MAGADGIGCSLCCLLGHESSASHEAMLQHSALTVLHASMLPLHVIAAFTVAYDRGLACSALCYHMQAHSVWLSACPSTTVARHVDIVPLGKVNCILHLASCL